MGTVAARHLTEIRLDELVARWRPGEGTGWYLADHLGTVRDVTDTAGAVADHLEYDSFGQVVSETGPAAGDRFKFTGQDYDAENGLSWYWKRYYNSATGRFFSNDPVGIYSGDTNSYRYVRNRTLTSIDPTGLTEASSEAALIRRAVQQAQQIRKFRDLLTQSIRNASNVPRGVAKSYQSLMRQRIDEALEAFYGTAGGLGITRAGASIALEESIRALASGRVVPW